MTLEDFERKVALRVFASPQAAGTGFEKCASLDDAIRLAWPELSPGELAALKERLTSDLSDGTFTYVVAAQKLTDPITTTVR